MHCPEMEKIFSLRWKASIPELASLVQDDIDEVKKSFCEIKKATDVVLSECHHNVYTFYTWVHIVLNTVNVYNKCTLLQPVLDSIRDTFTLLEVMYYELKIYKHFLRMNIGDDTESILTFADIYDERRLSLLCDIRNDVTGSNYFDKFWKTDDCLRNISSILKEAVDAYIKYTNMYKAYPKYFKLLDDDIMIKNLNQDPSLLSHTLEIRDFIDIFNKNLNPMGIQVMTSCREKVKRVQQIGAKFTSVNIYLGKWLRHMTERKHMKLSRRHITDEDGIHIFPVVRDVRGLEELDRLRTDDEGDTDDDTDKNEKTESEKTKVEKTESHPMVWLSSKNLAFFSKPSDAISTWPIVSTRTEYNGRAAKAFIVGHGHNVVFLRDATSTNLQETFVRLGISADGCSHGNYLSIVGTTLNLNIANTQGFTCVMCLRPYACMYNERFIDMYFNEGKQIKGNIVVGRNKSSDTLYACYCGVDARGTETCISTEEDKGRALIQNQWCTLAVRITADALSTFYNSSIASPKPNFEVKNTIGLTSRECTTCFIGKSSCSSDAYAKVDIKDIILYDYPLSNESICAWMCAQSQHFI